jgi:hypothetical protein
MGISWIHWPPFEGPFSCRAHYGWRGHIPDGTMLEVRPRDPGTRAEIPEHLCYFLNGEFMGAYLIERRRRQRARRK